MESVEFSQTPAPLLLHLRRGGNLKPHKTVDLIFVKSGLMMRASGATGTGRLVSGLRHVGHVRSETARGPAMSKTSLIKLAFQLLRLATTLAITGLVVLSGCAVAQSPSQVEPAIVLEYHGLNRGRGGTVFALSLFEDGAVVFDGKNLTRVSGKARATVAPGKVREWLQTLISDGALTNPDHSMPADVSWHRLTVVSDGRRGSFRFFGWNRSSPTITVLDEIYKETQVLERWVRYDTPSSPR